MYSLYNVAVVTSDDLSDRDWISTCVELSSARSSRLKFGSAPVSDVPHWLKDWTVSEWIVKNNYLH